jgi:hypothetical protein
MAWLKERYSGNKYAHNDKRTAVHVAFYMVQVISRKVGDYFFPELLAFVFTRSLW